MTEAFKKQILRFMSKRDYSPVRAKDIAFALSIGDGQYDGFKAAFDELCESGQIVVDKGNIARFPKMTNQVTGTFKSNVKGFGFVIPLTPNSYGDLFVPPEDRAGAMSGDIVVARTFKKGVRQGEMRYSGVVEKILERGISRVVGRLKRAGGRWLVIPDGKELPEPIIVEDIGAKGAKEDDKVVVDIVHYPTHIEPARGAIVEVLGRAGVYDVEIESVILQHELPVEFPDECMDQAREAATSFTADNEASRDDISDTVLITIDPVDAKDFDDAISLCKNRDGNWELGVHIADVSTFIGMESALDLEAKERGNSIYLPGKVIPMLPEILSNGICSLQPGQKRFAKSAYITYDDEGNILGRSFANSVICSSARLTYEQADDILKGDTETFGHDIVTLIKNMDKLARAIEKRRFKNGMLHLDLPETELVFDDDGNVVDAHPADDCYPHTIIEMFMVEANDAVASLLDRFDVPFMRRIHPDPEPSKAKEMGRFVKICGFKLPRKMDRFALQDILAAAKGTSYSYAINTQVLRSMQRAEYSPMHIGHFALASTHYCHFTSPIRRYADLMVHRLLQCHITGKLSKIGLEEVIPEAQLSEIGSNITFTEQRAADAEKELKTVLLLEMLSGRIGDELNCVVSGLTGFGVFVQCIKFGVEGLIEFEDLGVDYWKYDERSQAVVGQNSGTTVHLGDEMTVRIVSVNIPARQLSLAPAEPLAVASRRVKSFSGRRKTGKKQKNRRGRSRKRR